MICRIGILTGGGDCPGLNAVIRAIVKTAILKYNYEVIGYKDGYKGLIDNKFINISLNDVSGILDKGGTIIGTSNRDNPFNLNNQKDSEIFFDKMAEKVRTNMNMFNVDCLVVIGGDGTLTTARDLSKKGVKIIGVPKTIDNDLSATDITFGFMTAVETATEALDKLHSTAESHHRVMILEVMGRNAGWIALHSGIAGGADVIIIPEISYDINKVAKQILERKNNGKSFSIIVVSEGAKSEDGLQVVSKIINECENSLKLGGVGQKIADEIEKITCIETRVTVLGHLQRGGRPSTFDRILSTRYGVEAALLVNKEKFGVMVSLNNNKIIDVPLEDAVEKSRFVDPTGELVRITKTIGVSFGD